MTSALSTEELTVSFGGLTAVDRVSLEVETGSRRAIIGPNGAGKTTFFNLVAGQLRPDSGRVIIGGADVTDLAVHERTRVGVGRTFQISNLFGELSVADNIRLAVAGTMGGVRLNFWSPLRGIREVSDRVDELLETWNLTAVAESCTSELSYGQQRIIEFLLATATKPSLLLCDEPTAGVSKRDAEQLVETIERLPRDITIILVEHDMEVAFRLADQVTVMVGGRELITDVPDVVRRNTDVIDAYLGKDQDDAD